MRDHKHYNNNKLIENYGKLLNKLRTLVYRLKREEAYQVGDIKTR